MEGCCCCKDGFDTVTSSSIGKRSTLSYFACEPGDAGCLLVPDSGLEPEVACGHSTRAPVRERVSVSVSLKTDWKSVGPTQGHVRRSARVRGYPLLPEGKASEAWPEKFEATELEGCFVARSWDRTSYLRIAIPTLYPDELSLLVSLA